jgi:hypothetical protein
VTSPAGSSRSAAVRPPRVRAGLTCRISVSDAQSAALAAGRSA